MAEYIKKEDAVEAVWRILNGMGYSQKHNDRLVEEVDAVLGEYTAADVRPVVRGKWNRTDAYPHRLYCSVCYKTYLKNDELLERWEFPLNFCPNCGADMREES